jgi:mannose-1-phosphate guanylyltransferase
MKVVIFAGGVGTRLWPLSRKNTPKQFEKIIDEKSTLQLAVERMRPLFEPKDIFISSGKRFGEILYQQLPEIPHENFLLEPEMRDVGAAVGLVTAIVAKIAPDEPMFILWSDHLVRKDETFRSVVQSIAKLLSHDPEKIIFIGQNSRFASQNLGWIEMGEEVGWMDSFPIFEFKSIHYKPDEEKSQVFHASPKHFWNPGYFGTTAGFLFKQFEKHAPLMYKLLLQIQEAWGTPNFTQVMDDIYPQLERNTFDKLILEKINPEEGLVVTADLGWADVGAWESLKEALTSSQEENLTRGKVLLTDATDTLAFNYNPHQMVIGIDLSEMLVVNTDDVLLVCPKTSASKLKKLLEELSGTEYESLA